MDPHTRYFVQQVQNHIFSKWCKCVCEHAVLRSGWAQGAVSVSLSFRRGTEACETAPVPQTMAGYGWTQLLYKLIPIFWRNKKFEIRSCKNLLFSSSVHTCHSNAKEVKILTRFVLFWRHFLVYLMYQNKIIPFSYPIFWLHSLLF